MNRRNKVVMIILGLFLIAYIFINQSLTAVKLSGYVDISNSNKDDLNVNLDVSKFSDKANMDIKSNIREGSIIVDIMDSENNNIWSQTINSEEQYDNKFEINNFGNNIKIVIHPNNSNGSFNYSLIDK